MVASPRWKPQNPATFLLLSALAGAVLIAYFGRGAWRNASADAAAKASASAGEASGAGSLLNEGDEPNRRLPRGSPVPRSERAPIPVSEVPPSASEIEALKFEPAEKNQAISSEGLAALVPDKLSCLGASVPHEKARHGPGGIGCALKSPDGRLVRVGSWVFRGPDQIITRGSFENGEREGAWEAWYPNGFKQAEGNYIGDQRDGIWKEWDEDGQPFALRTYYLGRLHGLTLIWRGGGRTDIEIWKDGQRIVPPMPETEATEP